MPFAIFKTLRTDRSFFVSLLSNTRTAYSLYRLQIDRVRDPGLAHAVQIAEVEPLGETEKDLSPIPTLGDTIAARGSNPPLESVSEAFDGRMETKWLDQVDLSP